MQILDDVDWLYNPTSLTRQWQVAPAGPSAPAANSSAWVDVTGATGTIYNPPSGDDGKWFRCLEWASNAGGPSVAPVISNSYRFAVASTPSVTLSAMTLTAAPGTKKIGTASVAAGALLATVSGDTQGAAVTVAEDETRYVLNVAKTEVRVGSMALTEAGTLPVSVVKTLDGATNSPRTSTLNLTIEAAAVYVAPQPLDGLSGVVAAIGDTLLHPDYTGPLWRVRRNSDGAEQDIGFHATTKLIDAAALRAFAGASTGTDKLTLAKGYDQRGAGLHFTSIDAAHQPPINLADADAGGNPTVLFTGNHILSMSGFPVILSDGKVLAQVVATVAGDCPGNTRVLSFHPDNLDTPEDHQHPWALVALQPGTNGMESYRDQFGLISVPAARDVQHVYSLAIDSSSNNATVWSDDVQGTSSQGNGTIGFSRVQIGGRTILGDDGFTGGTHMTFRRMIITNDPVTHRVPLTTEALATYAALGTAGDVGGGPVTTPITVGGYYPVMAESLDTDPGPAAGASTLPTTFDLQNWSTSSSVGLARFGMVFGRGDVPAGHVPVVTRSGGTPVVQFDERTFYRDGSLKFCIAELRDTVFPGNTTRTYTVNHAVGTYDNGGTKTVSDLTAGHDFKVTFASLRQTEADNTTVNPVGSGNFTASFNAHSAVATRTTKYHSGPVCESWRIWGMATDNTGGVADDHLKTNWYGTVWKNTDGTIYAIEIAAVVAQDWWGIGNKRLRSYDAAFKDGSTTIQAYPSIDHPYHVQWITCQNAGGNNRGKRHWIGGAQPTLVYKPNKVYWRSTNLIAPYHPTFMPNALGTGGNDVYTPCRGQNHRENIDGTGAYMGRGINSNSDVIFFMRQTAEDAASMRINAHVGLHAYYHKRSIQQRTRPGDSGPDIANTVMSQRFDIPVGTPIPYDFRSDGMPAPGGAYWDYRTPDDLKSGYTDAFGGQGVWSTTTGDPSHAVNYSGFAYLIEGERYHLEATMDLASHVLALGNEYLNRPYGGMRNIIGDAAGGQWDAISITGQQRNAGFSQHLIAFCAAFSADTHEAHNYFVRFVRQQGRYLKHLLEQMPANIGEAGLHLVFDGNSDSAPWMTAMSAIGIRQAANITENPYLKLYADHISKNAIQCGVKNVYRSQAYRCTFVHKLANWDPNTNPATIDGWTRGDLRADSSANTIFVPPDFRGGELGWGGLTNGDVVKVLDSSPELSQVFVPGTPYYVVNVSSDRVTAQLSTSPGGAPIDIPVDNVNNNGRMYSDLSAQWTDAYATSQNPPRKSNSDDYSPMHRCVAVMAYRAGQAGATAGVVQKYETFLSTVDESGWVTWKMAG